jgi:hypothetical protein
MKARTVVALAFTLSSVFTLAQSDQNIASKHLIGTESREQMQNSRSPQQYQALADHYLQQEKSFRAQAASEKLVWEARAQNINATNSKYPRPVDSAHYLYDSYVYRADQAARLADHYDRLSRSSESASQAQ